MKYLSKLCVAVMAVALAYVVPLAAQTVVQQPQFVAPRTVLDIGNGPLEFRILTGNGAIFTSQGSGVGSTSGSSTSLTLTAVPTTAPLVGGVISGTGITAGTTVAAYSVTSITLSAAMTVASGTAVSWGAACPAAPPAAPVALVQAAVGADLPFYTYSRICMYGATGPGAQFLSFPIGAH